MVLSKKSKLLMTHFNKNPYDLKQTKRTNDIITDLYYDILEAYQVVNNLSYNSTIKKIIHASQITKPTTFGSGSFPIDVIKHIDISSKIEIIYTLILGGKKVKIIFITEELETDIETYIRYVDAIVMWLHILNNYASSKCSSNIVLYFYFTSLEKIMPDSSLLVLGATHVNTAFTSTCPSDPEIVVYRKEEWFKVFIHETIHNFGLDFSDMDNSGCAKHILNLFPVNSNVNLFESYAEFWGETINVLFCSFLNLKNKNNLDNNLDKFLTDVEVLMNVERQYSFFQLAKVLKFMGLTYKDLYSNNKTSDILRKTMFKENTNVLSYYIIKTILLNNYQTFLYWCERNNPMLLQFKKTKLNLGNFCLFIEKNYKNKSMLTGVKYAEDFLNTKFSKRDIYLLTNMRMSICEMG
jgi:hypothetical protein